jgi:hypothetical protein
VFRTGPASLTPLAHTCSIWPVNVIGTYLGTIDQTVCSVYLQLYTPTQHLLTPISATLLGTHRQLVQTSTSLFKHMSDHLATVTDHKLGVQ